MTKSVPDQKQIEQFVRANHPWKGKTLEMVPGRMGLWVTEESSPPDDRFEPVYTFPVDGKKYVLLEKVKGARLKIIDDR